MLNEQDKNILTDKFIAILTVRDITTELKTLDEETCISVFNEIVECIKSLTDIGKYLKNTDTEEKTGVILELVIEVLSSSKLEEYISPEVREQFKDISNNAEVMNIVLKVVNYINGELLKSFDNNNDGKVTVEEVESDIVDCFMCKNAGGCACYKDDASCKCCSAFYKNVANIMAKFFIKVLCCGCEKNYITRRQ
uniref:EF-hand domain-containing protein n=1 Tax=viral metagenome TaxID=1070528 RepID=A0A6C0B5P8_9ZZZZ